MVKLWLWIDTGPSGHGTVGREFMKHLLPFKDQVQLAVYTHQWGMPFPPEDFFNRHGFPDSKLEKELISTKRINPAYLLKEPRELRERTDKSLLGDIVLMDQKNWKDKYLMIKDFDGKEDISMSIGGLDMARGLPKYSYGIAETCFNPWRIPDKWLPLGAYCDEIWLPNEWNKKVFLANENWVYEDKLVVMPYGIDFIEPKPNTKVPQLNDDTFTFLCVARWSNMKGWDILIPAFVEEFTRKENVRLFIKTTLNQQFPLNDNTVQKGIQNVINELKIPDPPEIGISATEDFNYQDIFNLYGVSDCAVLPFRAEGVGRFQAEAMGCGLPLITTDWGGPAEFIDERVAFPLKHSEPEQIVKKCDWTWFYENEFGKMAGNKGMKWVEPDREHLQELMRKVFEMSPEKRKRIGEKASKKVREHFDWEKHINNRVNRLLEVKK